MKGEGLGGAWVALPAFVVWGCGGASRRAGRPPARAAPFLPPLLRQPAGAPAPDGAPVGGARGAVCNACWCAGCRAGGGEGPRSAHHHLARAATRPATPLPRSFPPKTPSLPPCWPAMPSPPRPAPPPAARRRPRPRWRSHRRGARARPGGCRWLRRGGRPAHHHPHPACTASVTASTRESPPSTAPPPPKLPPQRRRSAPSRPGHPGRRRRCRPDARSRSPGRHRGLGRQVGGIGVVRCGRSRRRVPRRDAAVREGRSGGGVQWRVGGGGVGGGVWLGTVGSGRASCGARHAASGH